LPGKKTASTVIEKIFMNEDLSEVLGNGIWPFFLYPWLISENVDANMLFKEKSYLDEFYSKATSGDNKSQLVMFYVCMNEIDPFDKNMAMDWLKEAAKGGLAEAEYLLGRFKLIGFHIDKSKLEAIKLIQKAANNGLCEAQLKAAEIANAYGHIEEEEQFYEMAAMQGDPEALTRIADRYDDEGNYDEAFKRYMDIAEQSGTLPCYDRARYKLAQYYANGTGCSKSKEKAVYFYKKVAFSRAFSEEIEGVKVWYDYRVNYILNSQILLIVLALHGGFDKYINDDDFQKISADLVEGGLLDYLSFFNEYARSHSNHEIKDVLQYYIDELNVEELMPGCNRGVRATKALLLGYVNTSRSEKKTKETNIRLEEANINLVEANKQIIKIEAEKRKTIENMMAMFAHKFRGSLHSITYNMEHDGDVRLYQEAVAIMRGLLDVFSLLSTDPDRLKQRLRKDSSGEGSLKEVARHTLAIVIQQLLSAAGRDKIRQHYHAYAVRKRIVPIDTSRIEWREHHLDIERTLQQQWECEWSSQLKNSASLEQLQQWINEHIASFNIIGFDRNIHFQPNGITDSLVTIVLNELLVNAFKYYDSAERSSICVELESESTFELLRVSNPSTRTERSQYKGSGKGHDYLVEVAERIEGFFKKPKPQDHFIVEFSFPSWALTEEN